MKEDPAFRKAIVIGGSMAGLLAARALHKHFAQVTILERDPVHERPESRKGQPQTRHVHALLASGLQILDDYFPDLMDTLAQTDVLITDAGEAVRWYARGGYRRPVHLGFDVVTMSRPFLEYQVRQRVLALPNVTLLDNRAAREFLPSADDGRVQGVIVEERVPDGRTRTFAADLVVDCTGRGSHTPRRLQELGYDSPPESEVRVDVRYASRIYRRDADDPRGRQGILVTPHGPHATRFGGMVPIENGRWMLSLAGMNGDHCPLDETGFLSFARTLPAPDIYEIISGAQPLSEIRSHRLVSSLRRHYEKLPRFPEGLLVLGDAIASFNPIYGQGMTSAAMQAQELDEMLENRRSQVGLAPAFFERAAGVVDVPWQLAVGADFAFPDTSGPKPPATDFINWYVKRVDRASHRDELVCAAFLKVVNLLAPPSSLFHPRVLWRVLWQGRKSISRNHARRSEVRAHVG